MKFLLTAIAVLVLAGCASFDGRGLAPGTPAAEVERVMGPAADKRVHDGETWFYFPRQPYGQATYVARIDRDGDGKAVLPDAEPAMVHAFATVFSWTAARRRKHVVFGPRFAFYPAVVQLADGRPGLDVDLAVVEDQSAIDRLCRFALARYQVWAERSPDPLRVSVDGEPVAIGSDGSFPAPGAQAVVVEAGPDATEAPGAESSLPFPDSRLP